MSGRGSCLIAIFLLTTACSRIEIVEDPDVIVELAEPVRATVWIPDPAAGKLLKVRRILPAGKLVVDKRKARELGSR